MVKSNILITGSSGQLGKSLKIVSENFKNFNFFFQTRKDLDISKFIEVEKFISNYSIDIIINCAAFTNVLEAETNKALADAINNKSVLNLAKICKKQKIKLIHISTDYVFEGLKTVPYNEKDFTAPINYYGLSKLKGEQQILNLNLNDSIIIRTSWLYSQYGDNFLKKIMKKLNNNKFCYVTKNEIGSPTCAFDLAKIILQIIPKLNNIKTEIFHFSNSGECSRLDFARAIKNIVGSKVEILKSNNDFSIVRRPKYSALDCKKICKRFDLKLKNWFMSLEEHMNSFHV